MKTNRLLLLFQYLFCTVFFLLNGTSCKDELQSSNSSITAEGIISGTISNYDPQFIDSIHIFDISSSVIGSSKVSDKGFFITQLNIPQLNKATTIMTPLTLSDSSAYMGTIAAIETYKNKKRTGFIFKKNLLEYIGSSSSEFYYSTAWNHVTGSISSGSIYNNSSDNFTSDLTLNKGWTETTYSRIDSFTIKSSNYLKVDSKWVFVYIKYDW